MATTDGRIADIAQVLMVWEPDDDDVDGAVARVTRSIESFASACIRAGLRGHVVMIDGAFDAAVQGTGMPITSADEVHRSALATCGRAGIGMTSYGESFVQGWPSESMKLTQSLRIASMLAPIVLRMDSDETLTDDTDLGALRGITRYGMHGAQVIWDTVGEHVEGSQQPGAKPHLRAFAASPTLIAGPAYHGSYKVFDAERDEWLALRTRGDENSGLARADILDSTMHVRIVNHPAERSPSMHEAKRRLLHHRYEGARSDR